MSANSCLVLPEYLDRYGQRRFLHTQYREAWNLLEKVVRQRSFNIEPVSAMILGEAGCGKTSLCKAFTKMLGEKHVRAVPGGPSSRQTGWVFSQAR